MSSLRLDLPAWLQARFKSSASAALPDPDARMAWVLTTCRQQVAEGTGGPFAAAVFDRGSGELLAAGVNLVEPEQCSLLHAEMVALLLAQQALDHWNLGDAGRDCELVSSAAPCAMCLGAIPWSGVRSLVCAARDEDVRAIGFDEGCKPQPWQQGLIDAGIDVQEDVQRDAAVVILRDYQVRGGLIYNG